MKQRQNGPLSRPFMLLIIALVAVAPHLAAQKKAAADLAPLNETIRGVVPTVGRDAGIASYRVSIPEDAFSLTIRVEHAPADLDIVVYGSGGDLVAFSELTLFNESLTLTRLTDPTLQDGYYQVDVAYQFSRAPVVDGVALTEIPFRVTFDVASLEVQRTLTPGDAARGTLVPDNGMADAYRIDVPTGTMALRIDVSDTDGDLDLFVSRGALPVEPFSADYVAQSIRSTETLVIDRDSSPSLRPGTYYAVVVDQLASSFETEYTLTVHGEREAPPLLMQPVEIPTAEGDLDRALMATVELLTDFGGGSGVVVSPRGHVLTNWHVVMADSGEAAEDITIGITTDPGNPAVERFQATVVDTAPDRDLALLQITSGRYGQELPENTPFPFVDLRREQAMSIGDDLRFIGYPSIGSTGSRATITFTRGTVAGFQSVPFGRLIKTDGVINEGSSGGAALDGQFRLVGLPTEVVGLDTSQIAYIYPVTAMPVEWMRIIDGR